MIWQLKSNHLRLMTSREQKEASYEKFIILQVIRVSSFKIYSNLAQLAQASLVW
jgi:hypothetical protein